MSIRVNDFKWEPGKNDAEYIKLLESSRDEWQRIAQKAIAKLKMLSKAQEPRVKYEYHIDHTDCIWYNADEINTCPVTCSQYRDGWNDAMDYIFKDGKGYRPYKRGAGGR